MKWISGLVNERHRAACAWLAAIFLMFASSALAKTPDGMPPSEETVCSSLSGAAFGLCNAYCEAQDCDVHPRPSCSVLQKNFEKLTGSPVFPCDGARCGNNTIDRGEDCDPPGSECPDGDLCTDDCTCEAPPPICGNETLDPGEDCDPPGSICPGTTLPCRSNCTCPEPTCGNGMIDPGEDCDGSPCAAGVPCTATCTCATELTGCCECSAGTAPTCQDGFPQSTCLANGCNVGAAGSTCDPALGRCVAQPRNCCVCEDDQCFDVTSPDLCPEGCTPLPAPSMCDDDGTCVAVPVP